MNNLETFELAMYLLEDKDVSDDIKVEIVEKLEYSARAYIVALKTGQDSSLVVRKRIRKAFKNIVDDLLLGEK